MYKYFYLHLSKPRVRIQSEIQRLHYDAVWQHIPHSLAPHGLNTIDDNRVHHTWDVIRRIWLKWHSKWHSSTHVAWLWDPSTNPSLVDSIIFPDLTRSVCNTDYTGTPTHMQYMGSYISQPCLTSILAFFSQEEISNYVSQTFLGLTKTVSWLNKHPVR